MKIKDELELLEAIQENEELTKDCPKMLVIVGGKKSNCPNGHEKCICRLDPNREVITVKKPDQI